MQWCLTCVNEVTLKSVARGNRGVSCHLNELESEVCEVSFIAFLPVAAKDVGANHRGVGILVLDGAIGIQYLRVCESYLRRETHVIKE